MLARKLFMAEVLFVVAIFMMVAYVQRGVGCGLTNSVYTLLSRPHFSCVAVFSVLERGLVSGG